MKARPTNIPLAERWGRAMAREPLFLLTRCTASTKASKTLFCRMSKAGYSPSLAQPLKTRRLKSTPHCPKRLRYFIQRDGAVLNMVLRIFLRVIAQTLQTHSPGAADVDRAALHIGGIAFNLPLARPAPGTLLPPDVAVLDGAFSW